MSNLLLCWVFTKFKNSQNILEFCRVFLHYLKHSANFSQNIFVNIAALPGPPTNIQVSDITATSVRLTWTYPSDDLQYYVITYKPKYANQAFSEISGIITMHYTVRSLSPYTEYEMYVIAVNNIGRGPPSAPVIVTTGETGDVQICFSRRLWKVLVCFYVVK